MLSTHSAVVVLFAAAILAVSAAAVAQDVVTVGPASANGATVDVPLYIRDSAGTPLGVDRPAGSRIQSFSIRVSYAPAAAVQSVTFTRAGITAALTPTFESTPSSTGSISLLDTFSESTNLIPFTSNAPLPGNLVAHLVFTLSSSAAPGSSIALTLDPSVTLLSDEGGDAATKETPANGNLTLVSGAINIAPLSLTLTPPSADVTVGDTLTMTVTVSAPLTSEAQITLASSASDVASVPSSLAIPAGGRSRTFIVTAAAPGTSTITASLPQSLGGAHAQATVVVEQPVPCVAPAVPQPAAPSSVPAATAYSVAWPSVSGATEYLVDEATTPDFASAVATTVVTTSASYSHGTPNTRYYYRVRAHTMSSTCDVVSASSASISVLITSGPTITRILAVVGSAPGGQGSYFKTSVQLYNPKNTTMSGKIVLHVQGAAGTDGDPTLAYALAPGSSVSYADLLPAMGVASGVGSADLIVDANVPLPVALVRVFNDGGVAGTTGFTEELSSAADALGVGDTAALLAPSDVHGFRLNIGIRTLAGGAAMSITVRDKDGLVVKTTSRTFPQTYFVQQASASILDGYALTGGETITFAITSGSAIVYGSTTDNVTNDPSVQFAKKIE